MTYREAAVGAGAPAPFVIPQIGLAARVFVSLILATAVAFMLGMAVWTTQDSFLECRRESDASAPRCSNDKFYPFGIATHETLPPLRSARVEGRISRGRGGSTHHLVLVLDHVAGGTTEFPGVGKNGVRAPATADEINAYLDDYTRATAQWHLRESVYPLTAFLFCIALGIAILSGTMFRRTRIGFDPSQRVVTVRVGRWPLRARTWQANVGEIERVERVDAFDQQGPRYSLQFAGRGITPGSLGLALRSAHAADVLLTQLGALLAQWRE